MYEKVYDLRHEHHRYSCHYRHCHPHSSVLVQSVLNKYRINFINMMRSESERGVRIKNYSRVKESELSHVVFVRLVLLEVLILSEVREKREQHVQTLNHRLVISQFVSGNVQ